jgi:hypothetical protein
LQAILGQVPYTPLKDAVQQSYGLFKELLAQDKIDLGQLGQ